MERNRNRNRVAGTCVEMATEILIVNIEIQSMLTEKPNYDFKSNYFRFPLAQQLNRESQPIARYHLLPFFLSSISHFFRLFSSHFIEMNERIIKNVQ